MIDARKHTLDSVKKLTDYSGFNLYKMDICYDYSIDKIIDRGIFDDESALGAILQEVLPDYPVNLKMPNFGCSAFTMKNPDSVMMGRNMISRTTPRQCLCIVRQRTATGRLRLRHLIM